MHHLSVPRILQLVVTAHLTLTPLLSAQAADTPSQPASPGAAVEGAPLESTADTAFRLREGLDLEDEIGEFRDAGGRIAFYPSSWKKTLTVLENLALERVYAELEKRRGERRQWSVTGVVTEYRGGNYLQIKRAIMKPKMSVVRAGSSSSPAKSEGKSRP